MLKLLPENGGCTSLFCGLLKRDSFCINVETELDNLALLLDHIICRAPLFLDDHCRSPLATVFSLLALASPICISHRISPLSAHFARGFTSHWSCTCARVLVCSFYRLRLDFGPAISHICTRYMYVVPSVRTGRPCSLPLGIR